MLNEKQERPKDNESAKVFTREEENCIIRALELISEKGYEMGEKKGWHDKPMNEGEEIALMHSELSEGLEALREGLSSDKIPDFLGIEEELADCIIRVCHFSRRKFLLLSAALIKKMEYNAGREYRHGNKKF